MKYVSFKTALDEYLDPGRPWAAQSQFHKMIRAARRLCEALDIEASDLAEYLVDLSIIRAGNVHHSAHISTIGGSGSHWIGVSLQDVSDAIFVGEVYFPQHLNHLLEALDRALADRFLDAIEIVHSQVLPGRTAQLERLRWGPIINSAHHVHLYEFFQKFRRESRALQLVRDPRDRTLSVTYRKPVYRARQAPDMSDLQYLKQKSLLSASYAYRVRKVIIPARSFAMRMSWRTRSHRSDVWRKRLD